MWAPRAATASSSLTLHVGAIALSVASAAAIVVMAPAVPTLAAIFALVLVPLTAIRHGVVILAAALVLPLAGLNPVLMTVGTAELRATDVLLPGLVIAAIAWGRGTRMAYPYLVPLGLLCVVAVGSALLVSRDGDAVLSAVRFAVTMSLAVFIVWLCRDRRDIAFLMRAAAAAAVIGIVLSLSFVLGGTGGASASVSEDRFGFGLLGSNMLGLESAFLVLLGLTRLVSTRRGIRIVIIVAGVGGLFLAKSVGSTLALCVSLALLYGLRNRQVRFGRVLIVLAVLLGVAVVLVATFRPTSLPWHEEFGHNSAQHRLITAYAGIQAFLEHPVTGVGWARSSDAIASPTIALVLRNRLPSGNPNLYPDIQVTGVHSAYVQVLAELGLIGGLVVVWLVRNSARATMEIARKGHPSAPFILGSLMLFGVGWNETSLFGGQPETFLFALLLGITALVHSDIRGTEAGSLKSPTVQVRLGDGIIHAS